MRFSGKMFILDKQYCAILNSYCAGIELKTSESDVYRRQILTTEVDPRTVSVKIFIIVVDQYHRYSNESERVTKTFTMISD